MKNFIIIFLCVFSGCSKGSFQKDKQKMGLEEWMSANGKIKVLSTTAMIDDLVGQIGQDKVDHLTLIAGEIDPHSYELVKGDGEKISFAKLVFCNGLGLEHGASLRYQLKHLQSAVALGDEIQKQYPELILKINGQDDPHIWMDISIWSLGVDVIVKALAQADPENGVFYRQKGNELKEKMESAHDEIYRKMQAFPSEKRYLVTSHDAFNYFSRKYLATLDELSSDEWKNRFQAPEGLAPDGQISANDIQRIIDHLCRYQIHVVFPESNVSKDSLKKIISACKEKGLQVFISPFPLYADSMGEAGTEADSYLKMIAYDADVMMKEWEKYE
jgi:manganese/zinc/iron transport system substrate-binding protein